MIVVDTSAIMAVLLGEPDSEQIIQALSDHALAISAGTLAELFIVATARGFKEDLESLLHAIGAEVIVVDGAIARSVQSAFDRWGKGRHSTRLNFGDCFAYATAKKLEAPLLYVGNDFSKTDLISVL